MDLAARIAVLEALRREHAALGDVVEIAHGLPGAVKIHDDAARRLAQIVPVIERLERETAGD